MRFECNYSHGHRFVLFSMASGYIKGTCFLCPVCRMKTSKLKVIKAVLSLDYLLDEVGSMKWMKLNGAIVFYTLS